MLIEVSREKIMPPSALSVVCTKKPLERQRSREIENERHEKNIPLNTGNGGDEREGSLFRYDSARCSIRHRVS